MDLLRYLFIWCLVSGRQCALGLSRSSFQFSETRTTVSSLVFLYHTGDFKNVMLSLLCVLMNEIS